ncbi:MAG: hypothetical protein ACF8CQ_08795, partial [Rhodopirellula sp. JB044]|uniref:hypothetical protein n=1 Tax=Rhodopirellula sp. JB044 TaxID=3342844 RepID=UPI00370BC830
MNTASSDATSSEDTTEKHPAARIRGQATFDIIRQPAVRLTLLLGLHVVLFIGIYAFAFFARFNFEPTQGQKGLFLATL